MSAIDRGATLTLHDESTVWGSRMTHSAMVVWTMQDATVVLGTRICMVKMRC